MTKSEALAKARTLCRAEKYPPEKASSHTRWIAGFFDWLKQNHRSVPADPTSRLRAFVAAIDTLHHRIEASAALVFFYREIMAQEVQGITLGKREAISEITRICKMKAYAFSTENTYIHWTGRFFDWLKKHHREHPDTAAARMEGFLSDLARTDVSASTQNQAFSALLFFYRNVMSDDPGEVNALRARKSTFLRHAPAKANVLRILTEVRDTPTYPFRLIIFMIYGIGTRVSEPLGIRIRDIDLAKKRLILRQAKGNKDRMVPIPDCLLAPIHKQITAARAVWERSVAQGVPVKLPHKLGKKYKSAGKEFAWFWLFPAANSCICRRSQMRVWWHCMPDGVQDSLRQACRDAGLPGEATPHDLRHCWATHAHDDGASIRDIQEILGHNSLETTMIYVHTEIERVTSPLQSFNIAV